MQSIIKRISYYSLVADKYISQDVLCGHQDDSHQEEKEHWGKREIDKSTANVGTSGHYQALGIPTGHWALLSRGHQWALGTSGYQASSQAPVDTRGQ